MDEHNIAKSTSNVGNQIRYDEYFRILKENASEITIKGVDMNAEQKELIFQLKEQMEALSKEHKKLEGIKQIFNDYGISLKTLEEEDLTDFERDIIREVLEDEQ